MKKRVHHFFPAAACLLLMAFTGFNAAATDQGDNQDQEAKADQAPVNAVENSAFPAPNTCAEKLAGQWTILLMAIGDEGFSAEQIREKPVVFEFDLRTMISQIVFNKQKRSSRPFLIKECTEDRIVIEMDNVPMTWSFKNPEEVTVTATSPDQKEILMYLTRGEKKPE